jgi:hypothetical protein
MSTVGLGIMRENLKASKRGKTLRRGWALRSPEAGCVLQSHTHYQQKFRRKDGFPKAVGKYHSWFHLFKEAELLKLPGNSLYPILALHCLLLRPDILQVKKKKKKKKKRMSQSRVKGGEMVASS